MACAHFGLLGKDIVYSGTSGLLGTAGEYAGKSFGLAGSLYIREIKI